MRRWLLFIALALCVVAIINVETVESIFPRQYIYYVPTLQKDVQVFSTPQTQSLLRSSIQARENILLTYPGSRSPEVRRIDKTNVYRVRLNILDTLDDKYYVRGSSLGCNGHDYFNKDLETMNYLLYLGCIKEFRYREARFISPGGVPLRTSPVSRTARFRDFGVIACNYALEKISRKTINDLLRAEGLAVQATIISSSCDKSMVDSAVESLRDAQASSYDRAVNLYRSAWRKAVSCSC